MKNHILAVSGLLISALLLFLGCGKPENGGSESTIEVTSVNLNTATLELEIGEESQLTAIISPSNASDRKVIWGSSNVKVVTVTETGLVKGIAEGSATITATAGGKQNTCAVTVTKAAIKAESISLDRNSLELEVEEVYTLIATVFPENASDRAVIWSSDNPSTAHVSDDGTVKGVTEGKTTIRAKITDLEATCEVNVVPKVVHVTSVVLSETDLKLYPDETHTLTAEVTPDNATYKTIEWSSSSPEVATVNEGVITPVNIGTTVIVAKADGISASCNVSIIERPQPIAFQEKNNVVTKSSVGYTWTPSVEFYVGKGNKLEDQVYTNVMFAGMFDVNLLDNQPSIDYGPLIYWPTYEGSGLQQQLFYNFLAHSKLEEGISLNDYGKQNYLASYKVDLAKGYYPKALKMSSIVADKEKSNTPDNIIYLSFSHPMTQIVLSANAGADLASINGAKIVVKKISITNLRTSAKLCVGYLYGNTTMSWQDCSNEREVVLFEGEKEITSGSYVKLTSDDDDNTISIIPQYLSSDISLVATYDFIVEDEENEGSITKVTNVISQKINAISLNSFDAQKRYRLFISCDINKLSVSATVENWNNEDASITID